jgi:hypothetical protein
MLRSSKKTARSPHPQPLSQRARGATSGELILRGILGLATVLVSTPAWAGMGNPTVLLEYAVKTVVVNDSVLRRWEAISFFVLALLLSALAVRWLWNRFVRDFPKLPRLSFLQSFAVVVLWGLLFLVVLTMIAGTRELMTPGTWQKKGLLYSLPENAASDPENQKPQPSEGAKP